MICGSGRALALGLRATSGSFMNTLSTVVHRKRELVTHRFWNDSFFKSGLATMARTNKLHFSGFIPTFKATGQ